MNTANAADYANDELLIYASDGIHRMITDLESYIYPVYAKSQPLLYALGNISFIIIPIIFAALLFYVKFYKQHSLLRKLESEKNLKIWGASLIIYLILSFISINAGYDIKFNFNVLVLPAIAKFSGPVVACIFAILQYILNVIFTKNTFHLLMLLIAASSGMVYGLILYKKRTRYSNCLMANLAVSLLCNVFMSTLVTWRYAKENIAMQMTNRSISMILLSPLYALCIFIILRAIRFTKDKLKKKNNSWYCFKTFLS